MAVYNNDFSQYDVESAPDDWTLYADASWVTNEIVASATAPSGKAWRVQPAETNADHRTFVAWDAYAADANKDTVEIIIRAKLIARYARASIGPAARMSGARGSENLYHSASVGGSPQRRLANRSGGSATNLSSRVDAFAIDDIHYIAIKCVGDQISWQNWDVGDSRPESWTTVTNSAHASGVFGIFFAAWSTTDTRGLWDIEWASFATNGDSAQLPGETPTVTPVAFSGTVPTLNGTEGVPFSESVASYFSGTETPFSYALHAGDLTGSGLSLNTSTGEISGLDPVEGSYTGLVIRATDTADDTADTNDFDIVIAAAAVDPPEDAPANVQAVAQGQTQIDVTWEAVTGATGYEVEVDSGTPVDVGNVLLYEHTGLTADTQYNYRIRAYNAEGPGPWSSAVQETTDAISSAVKGVRVTTTAASVTGLTAIWWDSNPPAGNPVFATATASTDSEGDLELDLDADTTLDIGQHGTLVLYKLDATDHKDSLAAVTRLTIEDIA